MRTARLPRIVLLLAAVSTLSCAPRAVAPSPDQLWTDFCHYVVIASPELAAAYGHRLLDEASSEQLRELLARDDSTTRRAVRLLDESDLTADHPDLGDVWARVRVRARPDRTAGG